MKAAEKTVEMTQVVVSNDGDVDQWYFMPWEQEATEQEEQVLFSQPKTRVHSDGWKAADHAIFIEKPKG